MEFIDHFETTNTIRCYLTPDNKAYFYHKTLNKWVYPVSAINDKIILKKVKNYGRQNIAKDIYENELNIKYSNYEGNAIHYQVNLRDHLCLRPKFIKESF
jgi:hypothetical protein